MPLCYYILGATIVACAGLRASSNVKGQLVWGPLLLTAIAVAILERTIFPVALVSMGLLTLCGIAFQNQKFKSVRNAALFLGLILALALSMHKIPGFNNFKMLDAVALSTISKPVTFYANFDKAFAGLMLYAFFLPPARKALYKSIYLGVAGGLIATIFVMVPALLFGLVAIDLKGQDAPILEFLLVNLLFVSMTEEVFFRGLIQERIEECLIGKPSLSFAPMLISALAFAIVHIQGGIQLVAFAGVAGSCYAFIYRKTESIEAAIIAHWVVNAAHFVFFTYPGLK